jgi:hypothetical protein
LESHKVEVFILDFGEVILEAGGEASTKLGGNGCIVPLEVVADCVELGDVADDGVVGLHVKLPDPAFSSVFGVGFPEVVLEELLEHFPIVEPVGFLVLV